MSKANVTETAKTEQAVGQQPQWAANYNINNAGTKTQWWAYVFTCDFHFCISGDIRFTKAEALADLPLLRKLVEIYAAKHGAIIKWEKKDDSV